MNNSQSATDIPELPVQMDEVLPVGDEEPGETLGSTIADFLRTTWLKRRMVLAIVAAGVLLSVIFAFSLPNVYTSTTTLMPPNGSSPYSNVLGMLSPGSATSDLGAMALGMDDQDDLFIGILQSRNVQDGLINRLDLSHYYQTGSAEATRSLLAGDTKIVEDRKSEIITISVKARNPVLAANMARGYVDELNRVVTENATSSARRERIFLEERVKEIKQSLDDSAKELSQFSAKSGAIDMPSQTKSMVDEGLRLQAELIDGRSQLAGLLQTYSEDNSKVRALEAHNAELQKALDKMGGAPQGSGTSPGASTSPYPTAGQLPALGLTYYDLERKVAVEEALWEALTKQYEAAKVDEAAEIPTVKVLDVANVPEHKTGPSRRFIVELGMILSGILALMIVFLGMIWERMDPQAEFKVLITQACGAALDSRRWYWGLPGTSWIRRRLEGAEQHG
jgi:uncharacterized protein involved in exopolysaccharide biosynthesis